jgi:hypothetical protein
MFLRYTYGRFILIVENNNILTALSVSVQKNCFIFIVN